MKVRKKPVEVEAWPVDELNGGSIPSDNWPQCIKDAFDLDILKFAVQHMHVTTLEGEMVAPTGWWIIKGVNGEFYPCDPDVFKKSYDLL